LKGFIMLTKNETSQLNSINVDVHHHILPPNYVRALEESGYEDHFGVDQLKWSQQISLDFMSRYEISKAVVSIPNPGVYLKDRESACSLARSSNEFSAKLMSKHPGKFAVFASLPIPDVEGALKELEYAIDTLNLHGVILMSNVNGVYLGDPYFEALFAEFNRRKLLVFLHPNRCPFEAAFNRVAAYPLDVTRAVANLMYHGVLERYREIRYILAHNGGALPYLAVRIFSVTHTYARGIKSETLNFNPLTWIPTLFRRKALLKKMFYDVTGSISPESLRALPEITTISNILMGTNIPFTTPKILSEEYQALDQISFFSEKERCQIKAKNAAKLFA